MVFPRVLISFPFRVSEDISEHVGHNANRLLRGRMLFWLASSRSKVVFLPACASVLVQMPLNITILILEGPASDLEWAQAHPRSHLAELARIIRGPYEDMMSDFDNIIDVLERYDPAALRFDDIRWQRREQVL